MSFQPAASLNVHTSRHGSCAVLALNGPLTAKTVANFRRAALVAEAGHRGPVVLDLSEVDEIDGHGLASLVGLLARRVATESTVALCGVRPDLRARFEATFCDALFPLRSTLTAALLAVGESVP